MPKSPIRPEDLRPVVHRMNSELFLIRGHAELALMAVEDGSPAATQLEKVMLQADNLAETINRIKCIIEAAQAE